MKCCECNVKHINPISQKICDFSEELGLYLIVNDEDECLFESAIKKRDAINAKETDDEAQKG